MLAVGVELQGLNEVSAFSLLGELEVEEIVL